MLVILLILAFGFTLTFGTKHYVTMYMFSALLMMIAAALAEVSSGSLVITVGLLAASLGYMLNAILILLLYDKDIHDL
jgi:hypothetical protein